MTRLANSVGMVDFCSLISNPHCFASKSALIMLTCASETDSSNPLISAACKGRKSLFAMSPLQDNSILFSGPGWSCVYRRPICSTRCIYGCNMFRVSGRIRGAFTAARGKPPRKTATICSATSVATLNCASSVEAPRCGVAITRSCASSCFKTSLSPTGSWLKTSRATPARRFSCSALSKASSSINPPRAQLISRAPGLSRCSSCVPISPRVPCGPLVRDVCSVTKSACWSTSSMLSMVISNLRACSEATYGSKAITCISSPCARRATSVPTFPRPIMPSILFRTSTPRKRLFSHFPVFVLLLAAGMCRANAISIAMVCSAAATMFPVGELTTMMPWRVAASMSILSTPTPARPTILSSLAAASISLVTWVSLRTTSAV